MAARRIRLCLQDLYHQDVVEMIERETRQFELWEIVDPDDPQFAPAYELLWSAFGPTGEMERADAIRAFLREDPLEPTPSGTFFRYFLLVARDREGRIRGVRDGTILYNAAYDPQLVLIYLSHIYMLPDARGTVLSYWLRIAPVEIAHDFMAALHRAGRCDLPLPDRPGQRFGLRFDLCAEMEYFCPLERQSWQRILFYGRGGFDVINPNDFPYAQPDFREPAEIAATGNQPLPFMVLVRRMGRERQARMPIEEARAVMRLLYDDFACHCAPEHLETSLDLVLRRLGDRATRSSTVNLLPLPTGPADLGRLLRLQRSVHFRRHYNRDNPAVRRYLDGPIREALAVPGRMRDEIGRIQEALQSRPPFVYAHRDKRLSWEGRSVQGEGFENPEPEGSAQELGAETAG